MRGPPKIGCRCPPIQVRAIYKVALGGVCGHCEIRCGDYRIVRTHILEPLLNIFMPVRLEDWRRLPLRRRELNLRGIHESVIFYHCDVDLC